MRNFVVVALTLVGAAWAAGDANAQRWAHRGQTTYIYPQGTQGYFVGPQGRSNYYTIPSVSNGNISQWSNNPRSYYSNQTWGPSNVPSVSNDNVGQWSNNSTSYYSNQSWGSYSSGWRRYGSGTLRPFNYDPNR